MNFYKKKIKFIIYKRKWYCFIL